MIGMSSCRTRSAVTARALAALAGAAILYAAPVSAQDGDRDAIERGRQKFEYMCEPCHGAGIGDDGRAILPGTDALRIKYRGTRPALLTERTDLTPDALRVFVRQGVFSMPPFRPTEITDEEIDDIAAYIRDTASRR